MRALVIRNLGIIIPYPIRGLMNQNRCYHRWSTTISLASGLFITVKHTYSNR